MVEERKDKVSNNTGRTLIIIEAAINKGKVYKMVFCKIADLLV